jgi:hypothetical protein
LGVYPIASVTQISDLPHLPEMDQVTHFCLKMKSDALSNSDGTNQKKCNELLGAYDKQFQSGKTPSFKVIEEQVSSLSDSSIIKIEQNQDQEVSLAPTLIITEAAPTFIVTKDESLSFSTCIIKDAESQEVAPSSSTCIIKDAEPQEVALSSSTCIIKDEERQEVALLSSTCIIKDEKIGDISPVSQQESLKTIRSISTFNTVQSNVDEQRDDVVISNISKQKNMKNQLKSQVTSFAETELLQKKIADLKSVTTIGATIMRGNSP